MPTLGEVPPLLAVLPFVVLVVGIAVLPLFAPSFWASEANKAKLVGLVAAPVAVWLAAEDLDALLEACTEYFSFVTLLGALYVVSGGIHVEGDLEGRPATNAALLLVGAVLANVLGTIGASMLLVRLVLRTNRQRRHAAHVPLFFIVIVGNCGGLLTPFGDPPLFLGYLSGVPFTWPLSLWPVWALTVGWLVAVFLVIDTRAYRREEAAALALDRAEVEPLRISGQRNVVLLIGVVLAALAPTPVREVAMITLAMVSLRIARAPREANAFTWAPIAEVAILFAGIFITMVPALALLEGLAPHLGLASPWQYFLAAGGLSSVLDNAPTYLAFLASARGLGLEPEVAGVPNAFLVAISCGAVLMGANTYIGNGPNFMVKAIAEQSGYPMPSFGGYAWRAIALLAPAYVVLAVWLALAAR